MMEDEARKYLAETALLNFGSGSIQWLVKTRGWSDLSLYARIGAAYDFVRNEINFGYNSADDIPASEVLADGYGQCNTKATLLMALLRALNIPCRLHGFTIHKGLQRGIVPELVYGIAPENILHSWVEVYHQGNWVELEGFILDAAFLKTLQGKFAGQGSPLCGYGAETDCLEAPDVEWNGRSTYIQKTGINADLGLFDSPDAFYRQHRQAITGLKGLLYRSVIRHWMNARVAKIRGGQIPLIPGGPTAHAHQAGGVLARRGDI
ncbi:transglutaminase family protein [Agrobacterium sp.]|uniref:transglutaminase-like domain-containing protein n=1 Tax=Agrobacterium sp. TaxID=361 RepID=UPI0028B09458|nr:transglutaminase family protein [Agrobacterium sp.]